MSDQQSGFWGEAQDGAPAEGERAQSVEDDRERGLLLEMQERYRLARDHWHPWRKEAEECFNFVAGHQWSEEDRQRLQEALRPVITFNRIGPFLDSVSGLEIQNRQETRYIPRTLGKSGVNELLTAAGKWCRDECDAEDEESDSFIDMLICGIGDVQTTLSYDDDPQGMARIERIDPLEVLWDPNSRKKNFADARYVMRVKDVPLSDAQDLFPGKSAADLDARWADDPSGDADDPHNRRLAPYYREDQSGRHDQDREMVRMVEVEWREFERGYRVWDPATKQTQTVTREQHEQLQKRAAQLNRINPSFPASYQSVPYRRWRYHRAVLGGVVLLQADGAQQGGFTIKAMTAKRDRRHGTYYGIVRGMIDPQQWANKFFSQFQHIINVGPKGGLIAEADAFEDPHQAEDDYSSPDSIIIARQGALSGPHGPKIIPKPPVTVPAGISQMMEFAVQAIPATTGISPEMMAQVDRTQPGVLEMQRKQQGMTILAWAFDALRRYRKEQGRLLLWIIQTFLSDGRLIRIGGAEDAQYVPLVRDPQLAEYDVVVDDTPSSPNMKERVWNALVQMFPLLSRFQLPPTAMLKMFEYSPLPAGLVADVQKEVEKQMQMAGPGGEQMQVAMADKQADIAEKNARAKNHEASAVHKMAEAGLLQQESGMDASLKQAQIESTRADAAASLAKAGVDGVTARFEMLMNAVDALLKVHGAQQAMLQPPAQSGPAGPAPQPAG